MCVRVFYALSFVLALLISVSSAHAHESGSAKKDIAGGKGRVPIFGEQTPERDHSTRRCGYWRSKCRAENDTFRGYRRCMKRHKQCTSPGTVLNFEYHSEYCKDYRWSCLARHGDGRAYERCLERESKCRFNEKVINRFYYTRRCSYWRRKCRKDHGVLSGKYVSCIRHFPDCAERFEFPDG